MGRSGVHLRKSVKAEGRAERAALGTPQLQDLYGYGILASTTAEDLRHHLTDGETGSESSTLLEKYKIGKVIGDGNFAVVKECTDR